jgi:hypothetical protein
MRTFPKIALPAGIVTLLISGTILLSSWKSPQLKKGAPEDTTKISADKKKNSKYSRTTIITFDEKGEPHERILEDFEGDESLRELMKNDAWFNYPPVPSLPEVPSVPDMPALPSMPNFPDMAFPAIPATPSVPAMPSMPHLDLDEFEHFGALFENRFKELGPEFEASLERMQEQLEKMDAELSRQFDGTNEEMQKALERLHKTLGRDFQLDLDKMNKELDLFHESWATSIKEFEKEAREELIKDGYLDESEKIESMSWSDDEIRFNDKTIKPEHVNKYREIQKKYKKRDRYNGRPE